MEFRIKKRTIARIGGLLLAQALFGESFQYQVRHLYWRPPHIRKSGDVGTLTVNDTGVSFQSSKHRESWRWAYPDIQQLKISPKSLSVLTYKDNKWKLGADRQYDFDLVSDGSFENAYHVLAARLDQRFVAVIAETQPAILWEIPAKHLRAFEGDEGVLQVGVSEIVYKSAKKGASRTWRYEDVDNISSSGPFEFTITTFERAKLDYGSRRQFNFALKLPMDETRYNDLWLRLNQSKGLKVLSAYREDGLKK